MKKYIILFLCLCCFSIAQGQIHNFPHMKFMGVSINGDINTFAGKLIAKGYYVSPKNKNAMLGSRIMEGRFFDNKVMLDIHYDKKSKIVFAINVFFENYNEQILESTSNSIKDTIEKKYNFRKTTSTFTNGVKNLEYTIFESVSEKYDASIGKISVSEIFFEYDKYLLVVNYTDLLNFDSHNKKAEDDI